MKSMRDILNIVENSSPKANMNLIDTESMFYGTTPPAKKENYVVPILNNIMSVVLLSNRATFSNRDGVATYIGITIPFAIGEDTISVLFSYEADHNCLHMVIRGLGDSPKAEDLKSKLLAIGKFESIGGDTIFHGGEVTGESSNAVAKKLRDALNAVRYVSFG